MFDRLGKDASGRHANGSRGRSKAGERFRVEPLEGRSLMTASLAPIPSVTVEAGAGFQVPLGGDTTGNADPQTYTVTTDNPVGGVTASPAVGQFWTIGVKHVSAGGTDPNINGTMTFQLFQDLTPTTAGLIESLITGTVPYASLASTNAAAPTKPTAQQVIYPNGPTGASVPYYTGGGNTIHRIASGFGGVNAFIVQGGSLNGDGTGQVFANPFALELSPQLVFNGTGQIALANTGQPDSNDSQFFITTGSARTSLDGKYTIFGQLVSGSAILQQLTQVTGSSGSLGTTPTNPITITQSTLSTTSPDGVIHVNATGSTANTLSNLTVTATDTVDHTQTSRTFPVITIPSAVGNEPATTPPSLLTVPSPVSTSPNTPVTFQLNATNPNDATASYTYTVEGGLTAGNTTTGPAFVPVANATATVNATGLVTVTPTAGYSGPINLLVGVTDGTNRAGGTLAANAPANYSLQPVTVNVGAASTAPTINPVTTPIAAAAGQTVTVQLSANNPSGGQLTFTVEGGLTNGAFTPVQNGTATVNAAGLVTLVPTAGYSGPIDLLVGVRDQTDRSGTGNVNTPSNFSTESIVVNVASATPPTPPVAPTIVPVATPIAASLSQTVQVQLSAVNPSGGALSYIVEGGLTSGAFTAVQNATAAVNANGLLDVIPNAGFTGAIDLLVGVRDQTDRSGTGNLNTPSNFSTEAIVINVGSQAGTGAVRFLPDSSTSGTGTLIVTPLPQTAKNAKNTVEVTQNAAGDAEVLINGVADPNQPALNDVTSIIVYGAKANDRLTIDPGITVPAFLSSGTAGTHVLTAGGGPTIQQGWYGTTVEKQGSSNNSLFGRAGKVTFVKGSGTNDVTFAGTPSKLRGRSRIRHPLPIPSGTFFKFSGTKLVKTSDPFPKGITTTTSSTPTSTDSGTTNSGSTNGGSTASATSVATKKKK